MSFEQESRINKLTYIYILYYNNLYFSINYLIFRIMYTGNYNKVSGWVKTPERIYGVKIERVVEDVISEVYGIIIWENKPSVFSILKEGHEYKIKDLIQRLEVFIRYVYVGSCETFESLKSYYGLAKLKDDERIVLKYHGEWYSDWGFAVFEILSSDGISLCRFIRNWNKL